MNQANSEVLVDSRGRPLIHQTGASSVVNNQQPATNMYDLLMAALRDPTISVEKLKGLLDIQKDIQAQEAERKYHAAMARAQARFPVIPRRHKIESKGRTRSKYAKYEDIVKAIRPILSEEGFDTSYDTETNPDKTISVFVHVHHFAGHKEIRHVTLTLDENEYRNAVQNHGSTITFAKRYALTIAVDVATEDEDDDASSLSTLVPEEIEEINNLIAEAGMDAASISRFLTVAGVKTISDISRGAFKMCVNSLMAKRRKKEPQANIPNIPSGDWSEKGTRPLSDLDRRLSDYIAEDSGTIIIVPQEEK